MEIPKVVHDACVTYMEILDKRKNTLDDTKSFAIRTHKNVVEGLIERHLLPEEKRDEMITYYEKFWDGHIAVESAAIDYAISQLNSFLDNSEVC